jgi:hypothetical protein
MKGCAALAVIFLLTLASGCSRNPTVFAQGIGSSTDSRNGQTSKSKQIVELAGMNMKSIVEGYFVENMYIDVREENKDYLVGSIIMRRGKDISAEYGGEYIDLQVNSASYDDESLKIELIRRGIGVNDKGERVYTTPSYYSVVVTKGEYINAIERYLNGSVHGNVIDLPAKLLNANQVQ